jgi:mono/diheme cytochrome c family protein
MVTRARRPSPRKILLGTAILMVAVQLVPYGRVHTKPPVVAEPAWDAPATRELARRACFDCHSNETRWPAYASVAPISWLVQNDVDGGRAHVNFSEWQRAQRHAKDAADEVRNKDMPPWYYAMLHPPAQLSDADRAQLVSAFEKMFGSK